MPASTVNAWRPSFWIFVAAISWWVHQNQYYGWHWTPEVFGELLSDFFVYVLLAMAFMARSIEGPR